METGYDTFLREEKEEILHFLKKQILTLQGLDASLGSERKKKSPDWIKLLKDVGAKSLNQLLKKVIPRYRPNLTLSTKELTNLRKKIKGWFNSEGTSEKRGDPLIHDDEVPRFKEELRKVMRVRNFEQLRKDILPCVKEIRMQSCKKFVDSMFSKKFWSTFLNKEENRDIKTIWESLPSLNGKILQKKSVKDMVTNVDNSSDVDLYESENEKMQSEDEEEDDLEDLETDFSILPEKAQRGYWVEDDKKEKKDAAQVQEFMDQIDYNDLELPAQGFSCDSEDLPSEIPFGCSQEAPIRCSQDRPDERSKTNFLDDFWDAWNQRASSKDAFPLTLSQDSHKPAYFSTLK